MEEAELVVDGLESVDKVGDSSTTSLANDVHITSTPSTEDSSSTASTEEGHDVTSDSMNVSVVSSQEVETTSVVESPHVVESVVDHIDSESLQAEVNVAQPRLSMEEVQAYLTNKIIENQCTSHAQEIHEYLTTQWTSREMERNLPIILQHITTSFTTQTQEELSLELQSSLCIIEQMFSTIGRLTPLQDMYTEEEQDLLYQIN